NSEAANGNQHFIRETMSSNICLVHKNAGDNCPAISFKDIINSKDILEWFQSERPKSGREAADRFVEFIKKKYFSELKNSR
uniref:Uncharacterized protein n=1 Tax=Pristionchus pacificus TaxID=54126 RepID=A0A2A6B2X1_PRIPA